MDFLISGQHVNPIYLITLGFVVGVFGGFFGVGGSFIAGPGLFAAGVPMNFVVGTDLAHIVGKSIVATRKHFIRGNVDMKLGLIMAGGTIAGTEVGAQIIEYLKKLGQVNKVVGLFFIIVLLSISAFMAWESWLTLKMKESGAKSRKGRADHSAISSFSVRIQRVKLPPMIELSASGIKHISFWVVITVAFFGGVFAGFLGGGAGYIRMPSLVYIIGVPTHVAVGTDLFEIIISASYGTLTHAIKGNVDILIALVMHTGAAVGAQIGVTLTQYFGGPRIRMAFVPLPLIGAALIVYGLVTGTQLK
jgi:uncharacterized membrane protein YfcA